MKTLLLVKTGVEVSAGLAFAAYPSRLMFILLGQALDAPAAIAAVRMFGAAIFALGLACWLARKDSGSPAAKALIMALLFYDAAFIGVLLASRFSRGLSGVGLWPVVILHSALAIYSLICLRQGLVVRAG